MKCEVCLLASCKGSWQLHEGLAQPVFSSRAWGDSTKAHMLLAGLAIRVGEELSTALLHEPTEQKIPGVLKGKF